MANASPSACPVSFGNQFTGATQYPWPNSIPPVPFVNLDTTTNCDGISYTDLLRGFDASKVPNLSLHILVIDL